MKTEYKSIWYAKPNPMGKTSHQKGLYTSALYKCNLDDIKEDKDFKIWDGKRWMECDINDFQILYVWQ